MDKNSKTSGQIAIGVMAICLILGALINEAFQSDLPCGMIQKKYHGEFDGDSTYQVRIREKYYHVEKEIWNDLNIGDFYCEK
jgi:hypothetical protein